MNLVLLDFKNKLFEIITGMLALVTYVRYRISNNIEDCKPFDVILSVLLSVIVFVIIIN